MDGIGWAGAAMEGARVRLETAAGNLANASTDGFHGIRLRGRLSAAGLTFARLRDAGAGALRATSRPLDLALSGQGSIELRTDGGKRAQTRGGSFSRDRFGRITDGAGRFIAGSHGALRLPTDARLRADGTVVRGGIVIDRMRLTGAATVHSGFLETADVDAIGEMVDLLAAQRSFETAQKALSAIDSTRERAATQTALVRE